MYQAQRLHDAGTDPWLPLLSAHEARSRLRFLLAALAGRRRRPFPAAPGAMSMANWISPRRAISHEQSGSLSVAQHVGLLGWFAPSDKYRERTAIASRKRRQSLGGRGCLDSDAEAEAVALNNMLGPKGQGAGGVRTEHKCRTRMGTRVLDGRDYRVVSTVPRACDFAGSSARREAFRTGIIARVPASNRPIGHAGSGRLIESRKFTIPEAVGAYRGALFSPLNRTVSSRQRTARYRPASTAATSAATTWPPASLR